MFKSLLPVLTAFTLLFATVTSLNPVSTAVAKENSSSTSDYSYDFSNLSTKTTWKVVFDKDIDSSTVNTNNVTITNKDGKSHSVAVTYNSSKKYIQVKTKTSLTKKDEFLLAFKNLKDNTGGSLGTMIVHFNTGTSSSTKTQEINYVSEGGNGDGEIDQLREENKKLREENKKLKEEIERLKERIHELENGNGGGSDQDNAPLKNEYFTVEYPKGYKKDADAMYRYLELAMKSSKEEFGKLGNVEQWLKEPKPVQVILYDKPTDLADVGLWSLWGNNDGSFTLHLLAKDAHWSNCCTNTGKTFDDTYFRTTTVHEIMTIPLRKVIREKKQGWNDIYVAPDWFTQGIEEYFGFHYGNDMDSVNILINNVKKDKSRVTFSSKGISARDAYADGTVLSFFLYERYGENRVHKMLMSSESTWEKAFNKEFGSYSDIEKDFNNWISKR
ncbi:hypothetical protein [uncultured Brevibacillus sp.]|uniref:hypothetical protein n=1 Tax=uncultured Brevibacillus sp. TaxID=169970 RepID=UPI002594CC40|nr:hypothetical protein [uncultured Brevibacillus sp.]